MTQMWRNHFTQSAEGPQETESLAGQDHIFESHHSCRCVSVETVEEDNNDDKSVSSESSTEEWVQLQDQADMTEAFNAGAAGELNHGLQHRTPTTRLQISMT